MGINALNKRAVIPYLRSGEYLDIPDLMMQLHNDGHSVYCYQETCYWLDIGRVDDYQAATDIFESSISEFLPEV